MIYEFGEKLRSIDFTEINDRFFTAGYVTLTEFDKFHLELNGTQSAFAETDSAKNLFRTRIDVFDHYSFCTLKIIEPNIDSVSETLLALYIRKNLLLIIDIKDAEHQSKTLFSQVIQRFRENPVTPEKFIFIFLDSIISDDSKALEEIEYDIGKLEDKVVRDDDCKNFNEQLMIYKKKLLILRNYYEQLIDIGQELFENENKIFCEDNLRYLKVFSEKAERLCSNVCLLRESIVQLREVYQANLDLRLNNTMKLFTVITTLFSPLSFIVGWYGMNFSHMPELTWKHGYLSVVCVCIVVVAVCLYIFKKKKLM